MAQDLSVIYYGIAIVKNTAPESTQPHSTSMICPMICSILGPILIPYNDAPITMPPLNHMIWIGLIVRVNRALAPIIMHHTNAPIKSRDHDAFTWYQI
ncbi:hypothetical protein ACN38_g12575 [Penicillium nordicum]|uniref:Uncharacterized protein n=1 Tax=Penicillium nordicum TaxID=229535 RepID=A0A0M9W9U1_9EURO|nr:hypothetical protein ACN38_g12575 [Penicillium nordicum]